MNSVGQKHIIKCRCILPQFRKHSNPIVHEFVVFSKIDNDAFVESFVQCNNCGIIHRVTDFCKSEIIKTKESSRALSTIDEISISLPDDLSSVLKHSNADLATFQETAFIIEQKIYDKRILLEKEVVEDFVVGKYLTFLKNGRFKIEPFSYQNGIKND